MIYEFISEGDKGQIQKIIKFSETTLKDFYNLAFGDKNEATGEINDTIVSNNGDAERVLATVVAAVYAFTDNKPNIWIYATGSSKSRTRLYRMGISKFIEDIKKDFLLYGQLEGEWENFTKEIEYTAFLVRRK
ncbi:MAG: hypothetical protein LH615_06150 [Ferruginibacter sp.]|nr:hypothetical protein [Ferruginibacter sp.]